MLYSDALALLLALPRFAEQGAAAYRPGLDAMRMLLGAMGRPERAFSSVHVGGTNGKGSTSSLLAAVGTADGLRVGLHTSPHLFRFEERLRVDGAPAPEAWVADAVGRFAADFARLQPSFFEASVALAFLYFAEQEVDVAVVEVGLGGRLDATNVLAPRAALVTNVALDHTDILGDTVEAIAREKGGIAKPGVSFLTTADEPALAVLRATAADAGAPFESVRATCAFSMEAEHVDGIELALKTPVHDYGRLRVGLAGAHQGANAALAVRAAEVALDVSEAAVREGLARVRDLAGLRGRCERVADEPRIVADVAHNPAGWRAALACAPPAEGGRRFVLAGVMADKDAAAFADLLAAEQAVVLPIGLPSGRALPVETWRALLDARGVETVAVADVGAGVRWFRAYAGPADVLLVTGSHLAVAALGDQEDSDEA